VQLSEVGKTILSERRCGLKKKYERWARDKKKNIQGGPRQNNQPGAWTGE
jgi:hypothetical protein